MMRRPAAALLLGASATLGFAPLELFPLTVASLGFLFWFWRGAATARECAWLGFVWGLGCFGAGVSWVYVSLHDVGGMAAPLAVMATVLFCAFLSLFPALAGYLFGRFRANDPVRDAFLVAGIWMLSEWVRGWFLTGFPWLIVGYSQTPPSPLAGYAAVVGIYGVGLITALIAAMLSVAGRNWRVWLGVTVMLVAGQGLRAIAWSQPTGSPVTVSLLQGNIPQSLKWRPENLSLSLQTYARLAAEKPAQITVLPETAVPLMFDQIPREFLEAITARGDAILGTAVRTRDGEYTNGAVAVTPQLGVQAYSKVHLVPFGEYVPPGFGWFFGLVNIPMADFIAGNPGQKPFEIAGLTIMPNICYEDAFGEEIIGGASKASVLMNLSNTAWFGDSLAQPQHLQMARMRALETGRPMLRATNTGMTAAIAPDGSIGAALKPFETDSLRVQVQAYVGRTPYSQVGNGLAITMAIAACVPALRKRRNIKQ